MRDGADGTLRQCVLARLADFGALEQTRSTDPAIEKVRPFVVVEAENVEVAFVFQVIVPVIFCAGPGAPSVAHVPGFVTLSVPLTVPLVTPPPTQPLTGRLNVITCALATVLRPGVTVTDPLTVLQLVPVAAPAGTAIEAPTPTSNARAIDNRMIVFMQSPL